ncbi:MAG: response regulator [Calothrix sp. SM1_7_51]|nr:response regulator [Calothrix sp. SM1_7_51]
MRILVVEDDNLIAKSLVKILTDQRYTIDLATDGQAAWDLIDCYSYDLILLDVVLPKIDGISLCRRLREQGNKTPILLLTAQDASTSKVIGLDAGADDYLAKPFDFQELLARIRALLRRGGSALPPLLKWRNIKLDPSICEVTRDDKLLHLTPKEYGLLEIFLRNPHRVFSCSALIDQLWSLEEPPTEETVRSHIKGLRQKLKVVTDDPIETVYGIGYRLKAPESEKKVKSAKLAQSTKSKLTNHHSSSPSTVSQVWEQVAENLSQRVAVIEQANSVLLTDKLSDELWSQAKQEAHKLVGSLGMFGSNKGSAIAGEIEKLLEAEGKFSQAEVKRFSLLVVALRQEFQRLGCEKICEDEAPLLWVVDGNREFTEELISLATLWGMQVEITPDPLIARKLIVASSPDAVLLDLSVNDTADNAIKLLTELTRRIPPIPVVVFTDVDSLTDRVKIARLGGCRILKKPASSFKTLETVTQLLQNRRTSIEARVMIVDDDPQVLITLQHILTSLGIKVFPLNHPQDFLDTLEIASPDLLILDVEMPDINGIELCQVIRNDPHWNKLPILFLTAHQDAQTIQEIFTAGADDYLSKPIVEAELVTRILNRLQRTYIIRNS